MGWLSDANTALADNSTGDISAADLRGVIADIHDDLTGRGVNVMDYGAVRDGTTDDTAAFDAAFAASKVVFAPEGLYRVENFQLPANCILVGVQPRSYTATPTTGTRLKCTTAAATNATIRMAGGSRIQDIAVLGAGNSSGTAHAAVTLTGSGCRIYNCFLGEAKTGINGAYSGTLIAAHNNIASNYEDGIRDIVDAVILGNYINANKRRGINLQTGANDNMIGYNKIEWNEERGILSFNTDQNVFVGNIFDRNGWAGFHDTSGDMNVLTGNHFRRNGKFGQGTAARDCHISVEGATGLVIAGNTTGTGDDDGGGGYLGPDKAIYFNGGSNITVSGNDLRGNLTGAMSNTSSVTAGLRIMGNAGRGDISVIASPDGSLWRINVDNAGAITAVAWT